MPRRQLALKRPPLTGDDVKAVQRKLGFTGRALDGEYGPITAARVEDWKWQFGYPETKINAILGLWGQALLFGEIPQPADFAARAAERKEKPHPHGEDGIVRPLATEPGPWSEFAIPDAEGAPGDDGRRYHAGKDWFAPGGSPVRAPVNGTLVEVKSRRKNTGQVFGGTVKIEDPEGKVWVFRHVDPKDVAVGQPVTAGQVVATVTRWKDGSPHAHIEVWKTRRGGYDYENMLDPMRFFA